MATKREYDEEGRRVKAALAYSRQNRKEFIKAIGYTNPRTFDRTTAGHRSPRLPELRRISEQSGVPLLFLTHGWGLYQAVEATMQDADQATIEELVRRLREAQTAAKRTKQPATGPSGGGPPPPPGDIGRLPTVDQPTAPNRQPSRRRKEAG